MGKLFDKATEQETLLKAWRRIRANGQSSKAPETRIAIDRFERTANRDIRRIQNRLRRSEFEFEPQKGVLKTKSDGSKRGIVMASVHNRIVERAWLDTLLQRSDFVKEVINIPTSVGGVPDRSVPHALKLINDAFCDGKNYFVRSDISGFFDNIPRNKVLEKLSSKIDDAKFLDVLDKATTVILGNEQSLGEDRRAFPTDIEGVAQGSPLSPLFGNLLLYDFDKAMNGRGNVCIRFIDDFLILGDSAAKVEKAFTNGQKMLFHLGLKCHDPFAEKVNIQKADRGDVANGFVFLGYDIRPGLFQPSQKARVSLKGAVDDLIRFGRHAITDVKAVNNSFESRQRYAQTLSVVDLVLRGWGEAFSYSNAPDTIEALDRTIDEKLARFRSWYAEQIRSADWKTKRRTGGVCLLSDIPSKELSEVPFKLDPHGRFVKSSRTLTISTDGSVITSGRRKGKDKGPGGWAYLIHETGETKTGSVQDITNNQMELRAVIEAIRSADTSRSLKIRTDSQYVHDAIEKGSTIKSNQDLWREYKAICFGRKIKVVWIKGHAGDQENELVDKLARESALQAKKNSGDQIVNF